MVHRSLQMSPPSSDRRGSSRAAELRHRLASRTLQASPWARLAPPRSLEAPVAPCRGPTTGRMRRGGEGRNFASPIGCDAKCVRCLRRRLEGGFDTQMHCAEPILGLGSHLGMLLESVNPQQNLQWVISASVATFLPATHIFFVV